MTTPVKILVVGLPAEMVREIGLRLRGAVLNEFDNAQQMGRAAAHGEARLVILSDTLPLEDSIYVARRAKDASDEMRIHLTFWRCSTPRPDCARSTKFTSDHFSFPRSTPRRCFASSAKWPALECFRSRRHTASTSPPPSSRHGSAPSPSPSKKSTSSMTRPLRSSTTASRSSSSRRSEAYAHNIVEVASRFGFDKAARVAKDLADRFAGTSLSPVDGVAISRTCCRCARIWSGSRRRLLRQGPGPGRNSDPAANAASAFEAAQLEGRRVLVVDDEPMMLRGLTSLLGRRGLAVTALNDPLKFCGARSKRRSRI